MFYKHHSSFLEQETFTPQKVLVIPRNRWLHLNMTEKLFTGTLNHNKKKIESIFAKIHLFMVVHVKHFFAIFA